MKIKMLANYLQNNYSSLFQNKVKVICLLVIVSLLGCKKANQPISIISPVVIPVLFHANEFDTISANSNRLLYTGRVNLSVPAYACFVRGGESVEMDFTGSAVSASLKSSGECYFWAIVDNNIAGAKKIMTNASQSGYLLADGLTVSNHNIKLVKISPNWARGYFYNFTIDSGKALSAPLPLQRKIEFYGDSQTEGAYSEGAIGPDQPATGILQYNTHITYAALTARYFNAQYTAIAYSGIGVAASYGNYIMPNVYDLYDLYDTSHKWDFKNYLPDIVVINLFQNDFGVSLCPTSSDYKKWFTDKNAIPSDSFFINHYKTFLIRIRNVYPNANIICALGNMNVVTQSKWTGYITTAVSELKLNANFTKIFTFYFPYKGTEGHPKGHEHQAMADKLISFIKETGIWQ